MLARSFLTAICITTAAFTLAVAQDVLPPDDTPPRHIYVPVDDLDAVIDRDRGGVMLSRAEYDELHRTAHTGTDGQPHLPAGAVLSAADYAARISADQLLLTVTAGVSSFQPGWSTVVLPAGGTGVESATLDGQPARLARDPEHPSSLVLFVAETGTHTLTLELSTPLSAVGGDRAAAFELLGAPSGVLTLTLPAGKHLTVNAAQPARPAAADAEAAYSLAIGGQKSIRLRISDRTAAATGDALTFAQTAFGVYVAPGEITWTARTALQVYGRAIDTLVCTVPKSLELTAVESSGLESWELGEAADAADRTQITLHYRQGWDGARDITFRGIVAAQAGSAWSVPDLNIKEVTSHVGRVIVQFPPGIRLQMVDSVGIRPVLAANGMDLSAPSLEYEVWQEAFRLSFLTAPKEREVHAAMTTLLDINADGLDLSVTLDARTLFAPLFDLQFRIPAQWTIRSVTTAGVPVEWQMIPAEAGINLIQVPLNPPLVINESRSFTLVAHADPEGWPVEQTPISFALPEVRLPQVGVIEALYGIAVDDDLEVRPRDVLGLDPARQDDVNLLNAKLAAFGKSIRLGYTFQDTVFSGQIDVTRKPSRVSAATVLFFRADRQSLFGHLESQIEVAGGGIRELQTAVSESAGSDLRFQLLQPVTTPDGRTAFAPHSTRIVEQVPGNPQNGMRPWTLRFDQRVRGAFVLLVDVQTPLPAKPQGDAAAEETFNPFVLTIPGADRETGHIAIESNGEQHVQVTSADAAGAALPTVDPVDFPPALYQPSERVVAGFRYAQPGWTMTIRRTVYDRQPVPTAVIHSAELHSVISETGEMQNQADYTFTAVGVQSLRLRLTQNDDGTAPELWSVLIDDEPVEVRTSVAGQLIALPPTDSPQDQRTLRLSYRSVVPPLSEAAGRLHQSPPSLIAVTGAGEEQPLEILEQTWTVHHAKETLLVDSEGRFHPDADLDRDSFLGRLEQWLQAPSPQDLLWGAVIIAATAIAAWVLSLGYGRSSVVGVVLALVVLGGVFVVLLLPATQQAREAAVAPARFDDVSSQSFRNNRSFAPAPEAPTSESAPAYAPMQQGGEMAAPVEPPRPEPTPVSAEPMSEQQLHDLSAGASERVILPPQADGVMLGSENAPSAGGMGGMPPQSSSGNGMSPLAPFGMVEMDQSQPAEPAGIDPGSDKESDAPADAPGMAGGGMGGGADFDQLQSLIVPTTGRGALLSLSLDLQPPPGYLERTFVYRGDATDEAPANLNLIYASRRAGRALTFVIAAGAVLLCWVFRRCPIVERLWLAALLCIAPLALMTVVPAIWLPILDGLLLGGIIGIALWGLRALINCCESDLAESRAKQVAATIALLALLGPTSASAQEQSPQSTAPYVEPTYAAPEQPAGESAAIPATGIIVPYDAGTDPLASQRVFLSHDQFLKLWNAAHPEQQLPATAPVDGIVSEALYAATLTGEGDAAHISVTARFVVHNFRTQQIVLSLPLKAVALAASSLDGAPAAVQVAGESLSVVIPSPGPHVLDVTFTVPARVAGPAGEFTLPLLPVPAGKLNFTLPSAEDNLLISVTGGSTSYRIREQDGARHVETAVADGGDVTIAWRPKTQRGDAGTVVHVETAAALLVGDAGLTHNQSLVYRVRQGSLNEITLRAPLGLSLKRIAGPDVGGWELADQGDARQFRIFLRRAVDDETSLTIEFHQPLTITDQPQPVAVPEITLENITRETGSIGVYAAEHFVVRATVAGGSQINAGTFSAPLIAGLPSEPARLAFRFAARPVGVELTVSRRQPETRAVVQHGVRVELRKLHIASRMAIELAGAPRLALSFDLPPGYLPLSVQAQFLADWYVSGDDDAHVLTIELDQPRTGAVEVVLEGHIQRQPDDAAATIELPLPLSVNRLQSQLAVWLDASYSATLDTLGEWKSIDPALLADVVKSLNRQPPQFAFQSTSAAPIAAALTLSRATPQLSADAITLAAVSETSVDYGITLRWKIRQAAAETFVVVSPGWLEGRLEFTGAGIRDVASADLADGRVRWTITLVDPVENEYLLSAVATLPPPANLQVALPDVQFEQRGDGGTYTPLATQAQYAVLVNLSGWQMSPVDPALVNSIARDELPFELRDELLNQAMEIVRIADGAAPAWSLQRLQQVAASEATVTACDLQTSLDYDGSWRMKAVYTVRNRGRQFLALNIPEGARVLSVFVRGAPSRTVLTTLGDKPVQLVALPQTSISDLSFDVELVLAGRLTAPLPEGFSPAASEIELPSPTVVTREQAEAGGRPDLGTPVIHTQWRVQLPDGIDAMIVDGAGRSNVTADVTDLVLARVEADLFACVQVLQDPFASAQQKYVVVNNLKNLNIALQQHAAESGSDSYSSGPDLSAVQRGREESLARNRELQQKVEENVREFEAANGMLGGTTMTFQAPTSQENGRAYIMSNSAQIVDDNGDFGVAGSPSESGESTFNFSLTQPQVTPMFEENLASRKGGRDRGELRQQLQEQSVDEAEQLSRRSRQSGVESQGNEAVWESLNDVEWSTTHDIRDGREMKFPDNWEDMAQRRREKYGDQTWDFRGLSNFYADNTLALGQVEFGGFGGGAFDTQAAAPAWTSTGGLSLPLTIPAAEQELRFAKVGGDPRLILSVRPRRTLTLGLGALWTAVCLIGGFWLLRAATRNEGRDAWRALPKAMIAVGLLGFLLIPNGVRWLAFAAFALGALAYAIQRRHHPVIDEE